MRRVGEGLSAFVVLVLLWQAVVWLTQAPPFILPGPWRVLAALTDNTALIAENALVTIEEVLIGVGAGTALGVATALLLALSPVAARLVAPVMVFSQAIPVFALAPVLTLWLGYGLTSKIVMAILIIYFPVASTFLDGLRRTDPGLVDLARVMGAGKIAVLLRLRVPAALPALGSGLRLAAVYAPIGAVIGEWVGASDGLGYLMLLANGRSKTDLMFAALLVLAALTLLLHGAATLLSQRLSAVAEGSAGGQASLS